GEIKIEIDRARFEQDSRWDGLKGYITNTRLGKDQIIENYNNLWKIEKAFRIAKSDLKIRPVYHRAQRRIEAHICIAFVAYKVYKELERLLKEKQSDLSPEKAIDIAKGIYTVRVTIPSSQQTVSKTIILNESQRKLADLFGF
ncbi:IS1634 family transposase, partial [Litoribacter populi]|uniref:IS1634 family transposase n=1 Tax=Litoribacter populi TaxID=2598460 RepID=UPI001C8F6310